ncbi:serine hydrolase domain-containing protein [Nocardiopsis alba]|uniref:serine hydrolase domain-containing protein n=1 Tax=Nocardiopsis alba TaxID=53437 RepID=UPI0005A9D57A|nr:serine hydrolase domain-containing protein [Nocardiopsis alba]
MDASSGPVVHGRVEPGFDPVRDAFRRNLTEHGEVGAAVAVHHAGRPVVDLWAGVRDLDSGAPWESDTLAIVFSATKGVTSMVLAHAHSRGLFEYDRPVALYWPGFARAGKERITVRELLSHRAGLPYLDAELTPALLAEPDYRSVELPHGNGFATARSLAALYGEFAQGSPTLGVGEESLRALEERPDPPTRGEHDVNLKIPTRYSLGLWKPHPAWRFGSDDRAYGTPCAGGSFGFADPATGTGYGYVPNRMGLRIRDDPRDAALRRALADCLKASTP